MPPQVHSLKQVAGVLGCGLTTVYTLLESKKLAARKMLGKTIVTGEELERFIAELPPVELGRSRFKGKPRKSTPKRGSKAGGEGEDA